MARRTILVLGSAAILLGALGCARYRKEPVAAEGDLSPRPEVVTTIVAREEQWHSTLRAIGTVAAVQGVMVSADAPGVVARIGFESGVAVRKGDVLVELDARQERAQLAAAQADRVLVSRIVERARTMWNEGVISKSDFDHATAEQARAVARVGEARAAIERKRILAPFDGTLGIRQVNLGQYLPQGAAVVSLQALDPIHVNFNVPQRVAGDLRTGLPVSISLTEPGAAGTRIDGRVTAIDSFVSPATLSVRVQASFANPGRALSPGMLVKTEVSLDAERAAVALPRSAINYAQDGDSVFVVATLRRRDGTSYRGVRQKFVEVGEARGDHVAVLSGVEPGDEVVTSAGLGLRNGTAVVVDNTLEPASDRGPLPRGS